MLSVVVQGTLAFGGFAPRPPAGALPPAPLLRAPPQTPTRTLASILAPANDSKPPSLRISGYSTDAVKTTEGYDPFIYSTGSNRHLRTPKMGKICLNT